jgi:hypothetical protein
MPMLGDEVRQQLTQLHDKLDTLRGHL